MGALAGPMARLLGAGRIIGSTCSPAKADRLLTELGYDAVVVPGSPFVTLAGQLREAASEGIDVLVDTVGGDHLTVTLTAARGARSALVGALSGQLSPDRGDGSAPADIDSYRVITQGITLRGYSGMDHPEVAAEWIARFGPWPRSGDISFAHVRSPGIERAPQALQELFEGRHFGTVVVELPPQ
ncbi:zinc-binding dehydrogenase [Streptomyces chartreusis]